MILVSFSSAEDVWPNDVNNYNTFSSQGTENPPFRFFWDTQYKVSSNICFAYLYIKVSIPKLSRFLTQQKYFDIQYYQCTWAIKGAQ